MNNQREYTDSWAFDIAFNVKRKGEIHDEDVINQSIELILGTIYGERFFNPSFGSSFQYRIFDSMDAGLGERLLDDIAKAINRWEDRITVLEDQMTMKIIPDQNTVLIDIPYVVNQIGKVSRFKKKIIF